MLQFRHRIGGRPIGAGERQHGPPSTLPSPQAAPSRPLSAPLRAARRALPSGTSASGRRCVVVMRPVWGWRRPVAAPGRPLLTPAPAGIPQVSGTEERPRLAVHRSNQHIYAQVRRRRVARSRRRGDTNRRSAVGTPAYATAAAGVAWSTHQHNPPPPGCKRPPTCQSPPPHVPAAGAPPPTSGPCPSTLLSAWGTAGDR